MYIYMYIYLHININICEQFNPCSGLSLFDWNTCCAGNAEQRHGMAVGDRSFSSRMILSQSNWRYMHTCFLPYMLSMLSDCMV